MPGGPGAEPEGPTELLPPVTSRGGPGTGPEPQLLTHREPDYDEDLNDDPDLYDDEDEDVPFSETDRKLRRKKVWRRVRRTMYVLTALMIITPIIGFFVAYQMVKVPNAEEVALDQGQVVTLQYANGDELSKIVPSNNENRIMVRYDQLPEVVKNAVFAAEDAEFMTNPGFDISGVLGAVYNQATGGDGGGSTITQQYIKKATGEDDVSITRKALEIVKAYKMNNNYSKPEILEAYLNTIYFGRGAYGIAAAAKAYYGKTLDQLVPSEAALLAGMIQLPGRYDDAEYRETRWNFVMNQMVAKGWLPAADRKAATMPALIPMEDARPKAIEGPGAHIQNAVLAEVERETKMDRDDLEQKGYTIQTTIDPNAQRMAQEAVQQVMEGQPATLLPAMTAVNPKNGEVLAYFGGWNGTGLDWAKQKQEPGSSFKPFDLVALLEEGKGLGETYDGRSGRRFGDDPNAPEIRNAGGASCGEKCTVATAMEKSINTVFYDIVLNEVGTQAVADAAKAAGVQTPLQGENGGPPDGNIAIGGGNTRVTTYEMASAYATFAANGIYRAPHMVKKIVNSEGGTVWEPGQDVAAGKPAFDAADSQLNQKIARNVTESLLPIPKSSSIPCSNNRQCAAKTGTQQFGETEFNSKAWTVGYTPQVSVAVSMTGEENGKQIPLKDKTGKSISGSGLPGKIWQTFMNTYLKDQPKENFPRFQPIGKAAGDDEEKEDNEGGQGNGNSQSENNQPGNTQGETPPNGGNNNDGDENDNGGNTTTNPPTESPTEEEDPNNGGTCIPPLCDPDDNRQN